MRPSKSAIAAIAAMMTVAACSDQITGPTQSLFGPRPPGLDLLPFCLPVTLRVQADAAPGGDGSATRPFGSIRDALAAANKLDCGVRIDVADGDYHEADPEAPAPLTVSRSLSIVGHGTPTIHGSFLVTASGAVRLQGLEIVDAVGTAVRGANPDLALTLALVSVRDASGFGVAQSGGSLNLAAVVIANTTTTEKHPSTGTALFLTGGTRAELFLVGLQDNVHGLFAGGAGTTVNAFGLVVERTGFHHGLPPLIGAGRCAGIGFNYLAAVEFASGAVGTGESWDISHSAMAGLYAHDGARVEVRSVRVRFSTQVTGTGPSHDECGGFDVIAHRAGRIDLTRIRIEDAAVCGVVVGGAPGTGIDLHVGYITRAPVGACVQQEGFDTGRLRDRVEYRDVGVPLQSTSYELPEGLEEA